MKISIIGAGATGLAAAAYLHLISVPFTLYVRNEEKRKLWETHPLNVSGKVNTSLYLPMARSLEEACEADVLLVFTRAGDHEAVTEEVMPYMKKGQCLLFLNGCWGAVKAYRAFQKALGSVPITIGEMANMPFIAALSSDHTSLHFKAMKDEIAYSAIGAEALLSELLHKLAPKVTRVSSPAATSLSATNPIIHVTQCLFNLSRIENGEDFDFFGAPLTKRTAAFMEECDKERLAIGKALGLELAPLLATLNSFRGTRAETLYEALTENPSYLAVKGPTTLTSRYITEDLPCGLTSLLDLSDMMHVDCPHITALVYTMALYLRQPYRPFLTLQDLRVVKGLK